MTIVAEPEAAPPEPPSQQSPPRPGVRSRAHRGAMRPRRTVVKVHRWLSIIVLPWIAVIAITGGVLVFDDGLNAWFRPELYDHGPGDEGAQAALDAGREVLPDGELSLTMPANGRGVYKVNVYVEPTEDGVVEEQYLTAFVDPSTSEVNGVRNEYEGFTWWMYRGHMYLWQDHGIFGVDAPGGWCEEPSGAKRLACTLIPAGEDVVAWLGLGFLLIIGTGFYLWYWPGVRRWATAGRVRVGRGTFTANLDLHRLTGLIAAVPLTIIAFTGAAFFLPAMEDWFDRLTPARADFYLWEPPEESTTSEPADGREPLDADEVVATLQERYPERKVEVLMLPFDETGTWSAWVTRGYSPWTRESGAGNVLVHLDQYSGETTYDGTPEEGNVAEQLWDDWSFPLHTGDFAGTISRSAWLVVAALPLVLGVTGLTMQLLRRRRRRRRANTT